MRRRAFKFLARRVKVGPGDVYAFAPRSVALAYLGLILGAGMKLTFELRCTGGRLSSILIGHHSSHIHSQLSY
ncbi:hypothetical protein GALMADRAFT_631317 [Galerina marginata CBS 339.88]|uniref:Uncharacterized protein n=1 Tax=Galerina marginata (strain CBS 339.88) TaxID=685588 RepID=A0A067SUK4_GALM3|nr:hypothetical protein GALMADRAFT_631317 [Galerina marginata CBS 339.88]